MASSNMLLAVSAILILLYWLYKRKWSFRFTGPIGFPLLGNVPQMNALYPHLTLHDWWKKHGGVFMIRIFNTDVLVISDYSLLQEALLRRGKAFAGRPRYFRTAYITDEGEDIAFHRPDQVWKVMRKTAHKCMNMYDKGLGRIEEISMTIVDELVDAFKQHEGRPFNPKVSVYNAVMNIICALLLGKKYTKDDDLFNLFVEVDTLAMTTAANGGKGSELDVFPFLRFFGNNTYRKLRRLRSKRKLLSKMLRKDAMEQPDDNHSRENPSVIKALVDLKETTDMITDTNVDCASFDLILAGTSTTTTSCLCFINLLANHRNVLTRLQCEVDEVLGNRPVSVKDREDLPYVQATLLEVLRYTSLLPLALPHETVQDTEIDGKFVPKGVQIFLNLWSLHHDEKFYPQPWEFRPERFLDNEGKLLALDHPVRKHLCPFGAGPRVCFGEIMARTRMFLITTTIIQKFDVLQDGDCEKASFHPADLRNGIVLGCPDYTVRLIPRECQ